MSNSIAGLSEYTQATNPDPGSTFHDEARRQASVGQLRDQFNKKEGLYNPDYSFLSHFEY